MRRGLVVLTGLALCGCVVASDKPIYSRDAVFDPRLVGVWHGKGQEASEQGVHELRIERAGARRYRLVGAATQPTDPPPQPVEADLVPLGKYRYLFMTAGEQTGTSLFPCYRVDIWRDSLKLSLLNVAALADRLEKDPGLLPHRNVEFGVIQERAGSQTRPTTRPLYRNTILTSEPAEIRRFLVSHQDDPDEFVGLMVFTRAPRN